MMNSLRNHTGMSRCGMASRGGGQKVEQHHDDRAAHTPTAHTHAAPTTAHRTPHTAKGQRGCACPSRAAPRTGSTHVFAPALSSAAPRPSGAPPSVPWASGALLHPRRRRRRGSAQGRAQCTGTTRTSTGARANRIRSRSPSSPPAPVRSSTHACARALVG